MVTLQWPRYHRNGISLAVCRRLLIGFGLAPVVAVGACGRSSAPRGFHQYQLGISRQALAERMAAARPLDRGERIMYSFLADDPLVEGMTQWLDRSAVESGDSVTVISTFSRDRLARVDVIYPPRVALRTPCTICLALQDQLGKPTAIDSSGMAPVLSWGKWDCCEVRLQHAAVVLVLSYRERNLLNDARSDVRRERVDEGRRQLR